MCKKHFDFNILSIDSSSIVVRVSSNEKVKLILMRGKFLPFMESEPDQPLAAAYLDLEHNYKDFVYDFNPSGNKSGFLIIIKDETNKEQYSFGFYFDEKKINIRPMRYGE